MYKQLREIIKFIGDDPDREGLKDTPARIIKSWNEIYGGYDMKISDFKTEFSKEKHNQMIVAKNIATYSMCEHHILPFFGKTFVAYIPNKKIIGLSKIPRIVEMYSRRLQIQERLTDQIADAIIKLTKPKGVGVIIIAQHLCTMSRGVKKEDLEMQTCAIRGCFTQQKVKEEFLSYVK